MTQPDEYPVRFGDHLIEVHDWFRAELDRLRADLQAWDSGTGAPAPSPRTRSLQAHCLMFCSAVHAHHTTEDVNMFGVLAERWPELQPTLGQLEHDHQVVSGLLRRVEALASEIGTAPDAARARDLRAEVDDLAALLESHFRYEERSLVDALNSLSTWP